MVKAYGKLQANDLIRVHPGVNPTTKKIDRIIFTVRLDNFKSFSHVTGDHAAYEITSINMQRVINGLRVRIKRLESELKEKISYRVNAEGMYSYLFAIRKHVPPHRRLEFANHIGEQILNDLRLLKYDFTPQTDYDVDYVDTKTEKDAECDLYDLDDWVEMFEMALSDIKSDVTDQNQYPDSMILDLMEDNTEVDIVTKWIGDYNKLVRTHEVLVEALNDIVEMVKEYYDQTTHTNSRSKEKVIRTINYVIANTVGSHTEFADSLYWSLRGVKGSHLHTELWKFYSTHVLNCMKNMTV